MKLRLATGALALVGAALASYLVYVRYSGTAPACTTGGCETVQASSYSKVLGVPVALLGLVGYVAIFASSVSRRELARASGLTVALGGVGFAGYLLYVQLAVIGAICEWCVASDVVLAALVALTALRVRSAG